VDWFQTEVFGLLSLAAVGPVGDTCALHNQ